MAELIGDIGQIGWVALKALLLYLMAVVGFRLARRRLKAQLTGFDFVAAVAVGAIIGRVPNSTTTSFLLGAVTLAVVLGAHAVLTRVRLLAGSTGVLDHPPRLLVIDGKVDEREMRRCKLTRDDLYGLLRQQGIGDLSEVKYMIYEQQGSSSVVRRQQETGDIVAVAVRRAAH